MPGSALDITVEVWDHIISMLHHDRHLHLQSLSIVCKYLLSITNRFNLSLKIFNPTADLLPSILHRFPDLSHLSLSDFHGDAVPVLDRIADFKFPLQTLDLSNQPRLPVEALQRFPASVLSGVKSLKICYLSQGVVDADLRMIANFFPNLEELDLSRTPSKSPYDIDDDHFGGPIQQWWRSDHNHKIATVDGIFVLASKLKGCLRRINLKGNDWVCDKVVSCICKKCPNLEEIMLECCREVTLKGIAFALTTCRNLKTIGLHGINMKWGCTRVRKPLSNALNLSHVVFSDVVVTDTLLNVMAKAKLQLKSFSLINCPPDHKFLTFAGILSFLGTYDSLHHLALVGVDFLSDTSVGILVNSLTMARSVRLRHTLFGYQDFNLSDLALVNLIQQCPLLETLEISQSANIKDASGLCGVINAEITTLDLSSNDNLSDECLKKIALACPNLERLRLRGCSKISNKGVGEILRNCHSLKHLNMNYCSRVKSLGLEDDKKHLELQFLGASKSGLDDKALIEMAGKCPRLMSLNVEGCNGLTTEGVNQLVNKLTRLKEINLRGCLNVRRSIVPWMVVSKLSMRKIVPPENLGDEEENLDDEVEKLCLIQGCCTANYYFLR